jgi:tricorn protease
MKRGILTILFIVGMTGVCLAQSDKPLLLRQPTLSKTQIVFVYASDLWIAPREGGNAQRLTTGPGVETDPVFSPDGSMIAFTGEYEGNVDVYVVPAAGGVPRRLTYHPGLDAALGWSPDGKQILFRSPRSSYIGLGQLFTIPLDGQFPTAIPLPMAQEASFSPDGSRVAYLPLARAFQQWKRYRGGRTTKIWIANLSDSSVEEIPRANSNDFNPIWIDNKIYFLSDRSGPVTLFAYDTITRKVTQSINNKGLDVKSASGGPDAIVYEQFGSLNLYDLKSSKTQKLNIVIAGDVATVRPHFEKVATRISGATISPTGARAMFEARGEIITVPAEKGNARNITRSPGVADRDPSWSPDGKWIAYFSDESGEYALHLRDQTGLGEVKKISLGNSPSYFYSPIWSPDSKKIAYTDKRLNLWYVDVDKGTPVKIDTNTYDNPFRVMDPTWAPDSRWISYTKQLKNRLCTVYVYSLEAGKSDQVTDGLSDARFASFDKNGKYLYFTASTDAGPTSGWLDMSSFPHQITRSVYAVVLRKDLPSPLAPESDEEKVQEEKKPEEKPNSGGPPQTPNAPAAQAGAGKPAGKKPEPVNIDFDNVGQRIVALPIPPRNYVAMGSGKSGILYLAEQLPLPVAVGPGPAPGFIIHKFELEKRKVDKVLEGVNAFEVSANGEKMLYQQANRWFIAATSQPVKPGEGAINIADMEVYVDPRAEWKQMYNEVWRIQRDFFYDPQLHGLNLEASKKEYEGYLEGIAHRSDLNYLFQEMLGNMSVGHHNSLGGDAPQVPPVPGGLLGADYKIENGRYRFARIYNGENWNPQLRAPLTQPGVNVQVGDYLLAVNGRELLASDNVYSFFLNTAGKSVLLKVGADPNGANSREVTVVPIGNEVGLRNLAWIEDNRRKVDQLSGGKLAYVYLPNTAGAGYVNFNRYYFAQIDKQGAVIDERFNGGGTAANYIIDAMRRQLWNFWATREGEDFATSTDAIFGPKAMIINEYAGSGGDAMPWYFRKAGIGPLVGKRTWGGLVGIYDYPMLIDGGMVTAPRVAFYNLQGEWDVENKGVAPDIEVDLDPKAWRQGHDTQLEKAIEVVMEALKKNPPPKYKKPPYPNYYNGSNPAAQSIKSKKTRASQR